MPNHSLKTSKTSHEFILIHRITLWNHYEQRRIINNPTLTNLNQPLTNHNQPTQPTKPTHLNPPPPSSLLMPTRAMTEQDISIPSAPQINKQRRPQRSARNSAGSVAAQFTRLFRAWNLFSWAATQPTVTYQPSDESFVKSTKQPIRSWPPAKFSSQLGSAMIRVVGPVSNARGAQDAGGCESKVWMPGSQFAMTLH